MIGLNPILVNPEIPTEFYIVHEDQTSDAVTEDEFNYFTDKGICVRIERTYWDDDIRVKSDINYIDGNQANHKYVDQQPTLAQITCYLKEPINPDGP